MSSVRQGLRRTVAAFRADDRRADALAAATTFVAGVVLLALGLGWQGGLDVEREASRWWHLVPLAVGCLAMLFKRRHPMGALGVGLGALAGDLALGGSVSMMLVLWDLLYAVQVHGRATGRRWVTRGVAVAVIVLAGLQGESDRSLQAFLLGAVQAFALLVTPLWWGASVRQGRELAAVAHERAELERERAADLVRLADVERHDAVRAERTAMARDLHDVIASHLSAIAITSGAALTAAPDPERDRAALRGVREASLASLAEMRSMIQLLRTDPPSTAARDGGTELAATPRLAALGALVEWARAAGLDVGVEDPDHVVAGAESGAAELPAAVDQAAHRIVREALTNALKHGGGDVVVRVQRVADADRVILVIEVTDAGRAEARAPADGATSDPRPTSGTGTGLVSMRERAESLGGTFAAGPAAHGWHVRAELPLPDGWAPDRAAAPEVTRSAGARS